MGGSFPRPLQASWSDDESPAADHEHEKSFWQTEEICDTW